MAFNSLMTKAVIEVRHEIVKSNKNPTVIELGNQRFRTDKKLKEKVYSILGIPPATPTSVKEFYESIGFKKYLAIDVNTEKDAIALDLNLDLRKEYNYTEQYNLVTNNGTGEHIFNQYTVFKNVHDLCKVGGIMIHNLPFTGYIDHGFYNFQPNLFVEIARSNKYTMKQLWIGSSDGNRIEKIDVSAGYYKNNDFLGKFDMNNWNQNLLVLAIMQKENNDEFRMPFQNMYDADITEETIKSRYEKN